VDEALDYLLRTAAWRESYDADGLVDYVESADADARLALLRAHYPMAPLVKDDAGNNVVLLRMAMVDYPGLQKQVGSEMFTKCTLFVARARSGGKPTPADSVYLQEKNLRVNPNTQTVLIIDLGYSESDTARPIDSMWGVKDWSTAMLAQIKAQSALIEPAYPESFVKIIFTRAPAVFAGIWAMAQLFIAEATAKKFVVLNADDPKPELLKHLPVRALHSPCALTRLVFSCKGAMRSRFLRRRSRHARHAQGWPGVTMSTASLLRCCVAEGRC